MEVGDHYYNNILRFLYLFICIPFILPPSCGQLRPGFVQTPLGQQSVQECNCIRKDQPCQLIAVNAVLIAKIRPVCLPSLKLCCDNSKSSILQKRTREIPFIPSQEFGNVEFDLDDHNNLANLLSHKDQVWNLINGVDRINGGKFRVNVQQNTEATESVESQFTEELGTTIHESDKIGNTVNIIKDLECLDISESSQENNKRSKDSRCHPSRSNIWNDLEAYSGITPTDHLSLNPDKLETSTVVDTSLAKDVEQNLPETKMPDLSPGQNISVGLKTTSGVSDATDRTKANMDISLELNTSLDNANSSNLDQNTSEHLINSNDVQHNVSSDEYLTSSEGVGPNYTLHQTIDRSPNLNRPNFTEPLKPQSENSSMTVSIIETNPSVSFYGQSNLADFIKMQKRSSSADVTPEFDRSVFQNEIVNLESLGNTAQMQNENLTDVMNTFPSVDKSVFSDEENVSSTVLEATVQTSTSSHPSNYAELNDTNATENETVDQTSEIEMISTETVILTVNDHSHATPPPWTNFMPQLSEKGNASTIMPHQSHFLEANSTTVQNLSSINNASEVNRSDEAVLESERNPTAVAMETNIQNNTVLSDQLTENSSPIYINDIKTNSKNESLDVSKTMPNTIDTNTSYLPKSTKSADADISQTLDFFTNHNTSIENIISKAINNIANYQPDNADLNQVIQHHGTPTYIPTTSEKPEIDGQNSAISPFSGGTSNSAAPLNVITTTDPNLIIKDENLEQSATNSLEEDIAMIQTMSLFHKIQNVEIEFMEEPEYFPEHIDAIDRIGYVEETPLIHSTAYDLYVTTFRPAEEGFQGSISEASLKMDFESEFPKDQIHVNPIHISLNFSDVEDTANGSSTTPQDEDVGFFYWLFSF